MKKKKKKKPLKASQILQKKKDPNLDNFQIERGMFDENEDDISGTYYYGELDFSEQTKGR